MADNKTKKDRLLIELNNIERRLRKLYGDTYRAAIEIKQVREAIEKGEEFTWDGNPSAAKQLKKLLDMMAEETNVYLRNATSKAWTEGEKGVHNTLASVFSINKKSEEEIEKITEQARNDMRKRGSTAHNYFNAKRGGLTISDRVWNITNTARNEIETIIQNGILEGKNPDQIAKSVQPYLREPHRLFRRVRNKETGDLELSNAAKKYKPGVGVYRSAYKNAMRLARTEVTAAYRRAEWETYQSNPLITGFRIELSNNHTTLVKGVPVPFRDICDDMVGTYPKTFLWTGWHPQCRCRMIPVFISQDDFKGRMKALATGKIKEWEPKSTTTDMPENFKRWIQDNSDRIAAARSLPLWLQENQSSLRRIINAELDAITDAAATTAKPFTLDGQTVANLKSKGWKITFGADTDSLTEEELRERYRKIMGEFDLQEYDNEITEALKKEGIKTHMKVLNLREKTANIWMNSEDKKTAINRGIYYDEDTGERTVSHQTLLIEESHQGKGLSRELLQAMYKQYQKAGIKEILLTANITVGGYAWARYGFHVAREEIGNVTVAHNVKEFKQITDNYFKENPEAQSFPMRLIADTPEGKRMLMGSAWDGFLDLTDKAAVKTFENYIFNRK